MFSKLIVGLALIAAPPASTQTLPSERVPPTDAYSVWKDCLADALAVYAGLKEEPRAIVEASLSKCRRQQDALMSHVLSVRSHAGFPNTAAVIEELTNTTVQDQRDWMLPALLDMKLQGLAP